MREGSIRGYTRIPESDFLKGPNHIYKFYITNPIGNIFVKKGDETIIPVTTNSESIGAFKLNLRL